jgi:hypothetical protein
MKTRGKILLFVVAIFVCALVSLGGTWFWYLNHYVHQHCIKQVGLAFRIYSSDHQGQLPFSTNGFGDALLLFAKADPTVINTICGPGDDGHIFKDALKSNSVVPEDQCSRVYIQGLNETSDPSICILFDRNSCKGGDHFRSPWGHRLREACMLDGSMQVIRDEDWPEFSKKQVELLVAAGFTKTNALYFYPAAK